MLVTEKEIAKHTAKKMNIPFEETLNIYKSTISYVIHVMKHSGFDTVKLPYFGKFTVKPYRLQKYNEQKIKRKNGLI